MVLTAENYYSQRVCMVCDEGTTQNVPPRKTVLYAGTEQSVCGYAPGQYRAGESHEDADCNAYQVSGKQGSQGHHETGKQGGRQEEWIQAHI